MIGHHARLSAGFGAKYTGLLALLVGVALAAWETGAITHGDWSAFAASAVKLAPIGLIAGALVGAIVFLLIGFAVALLGLKRVGWTFTYTVLGGLAFAFAAHLFQPLIVSVSEVFAGPYGVVTAALLAALTGAVSGSLVAGGLKDSATI